jgi:hypothetical protein
MKKTFLSSILILSFICAIAQTAKWFLLSKQDFTIEFPKKPETTSQKQETALGKIVMDINMLETAEKDKDSNLVYGAISTEYPKGNFETEDKKRDDNVLEGAVEGAVNSTKGKLLSKKDISIDGFSGKEIRIDYQNGTAIIKMRTYLIKNKVIMTQAIYLPINENNANAERFFNSLKLVK